MRGSVEERLEEHERRIIRLEDRLEYIVAKINDIDRKVDLIARVVAKNSQGYKWTIAILVIILSFVAAMFGLGWRPP